MKKKSFLTLITTIFLFQLSAQTEFSGGIFEDTTWTKENSPYIITGDIAIYPSVTLTIEPGTILEFYDNTTFYIRGNLLALGNAADSIVFTSNSEEPSSTSWSGVVIENNLGGNAVFKYFIGSYAADLIRIFSSSSGEVLLVENSYFHDNDYTFYGYDGSSNFTVSIDSCVFENNYYGFVYGSNLTISNSIFRNGTKGVHGWSGPNITITNCEFSGITTWPTNMAGTISNSTFKENTVGVRLKSDLTVTGCEIFNNTIGVEIVSSIPISDYLLENNTISGNTEYNIKHLYSYNVDATNNCWCTNEESEIATTIYDAYDNASLGIVDFTPFLTDCSNANTVSIFDTICMGDTLMGYYESGIYYYTDIIEGVCNTTELNLIVLDIDSIAIDTSICFGESYLGFDTTGTYYITETSTSGCDSIIQLNLDVMSIDTVHLDMDICEGENYLGYDSTGTFYINETSMAGCDSIIMLDLFVISVDTVHLDLGICEGEDYLGYDSTGIYYITEIAASGCDSIIELNLLVMPIDSVLIDTAICEGENYLGFDTTGIYYIIETSQAGCDSIIELSLTVNQKYFFSDSVVLCEGEDYFWQGETYNQTGFYEADFVSNEGCDSIYYLSLQVIPLPLAEFTYTNELGTVTFANTSENASSYLWDFGDGETSIEVNPVHSYDLSGSYLVKLNAITEYCGEAVDSQLIQISTSAKIIEFDDLARVYPNPSSGELYIELLNKLNEEITISIIDINGRIIFEHEIKMNKEFIDLYGFTRGIYLFRLLGSSFVMNKRIILK